MVTDRQIRIVCLLFCVLSCTRYDNTLPSESCVPVSLSAMAEKAKSVVSGTTLPDTYTIYTSSFFTSYTAPETDGNYFVAVPFRYDGGVWVTTPVIYWPFGGTLDFISISCEDNAIDMNKCAVWRDDNCSVGVELNLEDGRCLDSEILFSAICGCKAGDGSVPMKFKHAQSWLQFVISSATEVLRIDRIVLESVYAGGLFRISNDVYLEAEWSYRGHRKKDVTVPGSEGLLPQTMPSVCNILVPEQQACDIAIYYSVKGSPSDEWSTARSSVYRYKAGSNPWFYGEKNVYRVSFEFTEIAVTASVRHWEDQTENISFGE